MGNTDSNSTLKQPETTKCNYRISWEPDPCRIYYIDATECPCPKWKFRYYYGYRSPCRIYNCHDVPYFSNHLLATNRDIPSRMVNPNDTLIPLGNAAIVAEESAEVAQAEISLTMVAAMGGLALLSMLLVCAMGLYLKKVRRRYNNAIIALAEGGERDEEEDDSLDFDEEIAARRALNRKKEEKKKRKRKKSSLRVLLGPNGPLRKKSTPSAVIC